MKTILLIEDDSEMLLGIKDNLEMMGYGVVAARDGETGISKAFQARPDAVILDLMLPGVDGFDVCRTLRSRGLRMPILMLTARGDETDKVLGLELGADDYVTKPFSIHELLARIKAMLRRANGGAPAADLYRFGDVMLDFRSHRGEKAGRPLVMSALEFEVMRYLIRHAGNVVSREQLLTDIWGYRGSPMTRSVDTLIGRLRHKLEDQPHAPRHILTIHGVGYKFAD